MFIELHMDGNGKRILVNTAWISVVESAGWIDIGDSGEMVLCDESYDEIVGMIKGCNSMYKEGDT